MLSIVDVCFLEVIFIQPGKITEASDNGRNPIAAGERDGVGILYELKRLLEVGVVGDSFPECRKDPVDAPETPSDYIGGASDGTDRRIHFVGDAGDQISQDAIFSRNMS